MTFCFLKVWPFEGNSEVVNVGWRDGIRQQYSTAHLGVFDLLEITPTLLDYQPNSTSGKYCVVYFKLGKNRCTPFWSYWWSSFQWWERKWECSKCDVIYHSGKYFPKTVSPWMVKGQIHIWTFRITRSFGLSGFHNFLIYFILIFKSQKKSCFLTKLEPIKSSSFS